jgi:Zn-dependent protease with chaperone function
MIGALRRLQEITQSGGVIDNRSASLNAFKINHPSGVMRLFATHPPIEERIAALESRA